MAWTEQCKIAFKTNAQGKLLKYKNKSRKVTFVLHELANESGIPFKTLNRWYYDKSDAIYPKNEVDSISPPKEIPQIPTCYRCKKNPVYIDKRVGKPMTQGSKYYGLCNACRINQSRIEKIDRQATESKDGLMTVCPHCSKPHYMNPGTKYDRNKGE